VKRVKLYKELKLDLKDTNIISVVGGGGKTTTITTLARELKIEGKKVLISTTTGIFIPNRNSYDNIFIGRFPNKFKPQSSSITYYAERVDGIKLKTGDISKIENVIERDVFDFILLEADGSKGKPIKAPASHEPVISKYTTVIIGVIGLDCLGTTINDDNVHRPELLIKLAEDGVKTVDIDLILALIKSKNGLYKNSIGRKILFLNKANNNYRICKAAEIKERLKDDDIKVFSGDIKSNRYF